MALSSYDSPLQPIDFRGREQLIKIACDRLKDPEYLSTVFIGAPKRGKTSLLRFLSSSYADPHLAGHPADLRLYLDAELLGVNATASDFWIQFFRRLRTQRPALTDLVAAPLDKAEAGKLKIYHLEDFFDQCAAKQLKLVALVDNWESLLRNDAFWPPASDFLHLVRYFGQRTPRTVAFVVACQRPLLDLWDGSRKASPYYNILVSVDLPALLAQDIVAFVDAVFGAADPNVRAEVATLATTLSGSDQSHPRLVSYVTWQCLQLFTANGSIGKAADDVALAYQDPQGPLVTLNQAMRSALSNAERQLLDTARTSPAALLPAQKERLKVLARQGFVPPGVEVV